MDVLIGHKEEYEFLSKWVQSPFPRKPSYYIITGITGVGKKTLIKHVLFDHEISTFSPEDKKNDILDELKKKINTTTFSDFFEDFSKCAILIEDVDKTLGDSKHFKDVIKLSEKSKYPIFMTCQKKKRTYKNVIRLNQVDENFLFLFFKKKYKLLNDKKIKYIIKNSKGDIRLIKNTIETVVLSKNNTLKGISFKDSFVISNEAIQDVLKNNHEYDLNKKIDIFETDFQNISEMLFYNLPNTSKFTKKKSLEDMTRLSRVYENVSYGDIIMKKIIIGFKNELLEHFIIVLCISIINNIHYTKRFKPTKLSIPHVEYNFPPDIFSFLMSFKYLTVPKLFNEGKIEYSEQNELTKHLFIKLFKIVFKRTLKKNEKETVSKFLF